MRADAVPLAWVRGLALAMVLGSSLAAVEPVPRIACIGDSITAGYGLDDQSGNWPNTLARLLAARSAVVGNFGVSGTTLLKNGNLPYWETAELGRAGEFAPTLVLIMLGTNDSKSSVWDAHAGEFADDLTAMVALFRDGPSRPRVALLTPPAVYSGAFGIRADNVVDGVIPAIRGVAERLALPVIEVHAATSGHPEWFPDGVHPNADGMAAIAATVAAALGRIEAPGPGTPPPAGDPGADAGSGSGASSRAGGEAGGRRGCGLGSGFTLVLGSLALGSARRARRG